MTSPRGTQFQLYGKNESTEGTPPSGNWARLPVMTFDQGGNRALQQDPTLSRALGRNAPDPYQGALEVQMSAEVPMDRGNLGFWLTLMFGAATSTGSGPYTDVWTPRAAGVDLPTASLEAVRASTATTRYHLRSAVKANTLSIRVDFTAGLQTMSLGLIGRSATDNGSSAAGTPTTAAWLCHQKQRWAVSLDGSAAADVTALDLTITNNLEPYGTVRDQANGVAYAIDEGLFQITGSVTFRTASNAIMADALALTSRELTLVNTLGTNDHITFDMGNIYFEFPQAPVQGPGVIQQTARFSAAYDAVDTTMLTVTRVRSVVV